MTTITAYRTPQAFLDATERLLEQRELENNLILGLCNGFADRTRVYDTCVFINAVEDSEIRASSIRTVSKAVVSGTTQDLRHIKALADHYSDNGIDLTGVVGESRYSKAFAAFYGKPQVGERTMIAHRLASVNDLPSATGDLKVADRNDINLLTEWTQRFEEDTGTFPRRSDAQIRSSTEKMVGAGTVFKWVDNGETVSIAAIVRRKRRFGIVGLVYTPDRWRGKGYASGAVKRLSRHILQSGSEYCGLFTDRANPTSNNIYRRIGYVPTTEFTDIEFA